MTETTPFTIGADASCSDGACGKVTRVVVDPVARTVTHLVVEPKHRLDVGRLVPLGLADATAGEIRLRCTLADFEKLDPAEETQFLPGTPGYPGHDPEQVLSMPYYGMGPGLGGAYVPVTVTYDAVPLDEVEVRRGEHVHATDGHIGKVQGLVIDPNSHHVTHVLLQEGHLWGRKEVAIPIGAVTGPTTVSGSTSPSSRCRTCRPWTSTTRTGRPASVPEAHRRRAAYPIRPGFPALRCGLGDKASSASRDQPRTRRATAWGPQIVLSSPKFLCGIRSEHFRNHAADRSAAVGLNGLDIADQDLAGLFNLRLLVVRQRFGG